MPIVSGATHDLFVSYARISNAGYEDAGQGWVTRVVTILRNVLGQRAGRLDYDIYFDLEQREVGRLESHIEKHVSGSACLLFILSRASLRSARCIGEFISFLDSHPHDFAERLVIVDMDNPLGSPEFLADLREECDHHVSPALGRLLAECQSQIRIECFSHVAPGQICPLDHPPEGPGSKSQVLLYKKITDVGTIVSDKLSRLRRNARQSAAEVRVQPAANGGVAARGSSDPSGTAKLKVPVYVALGTAAAQEHRDELLRTLAENPHIEVQPANSQQLWPGSVSPEDFTAKVDALVCRARIFALLLGGRQPSMTADRRFVVSAEDMPGEYLQIQLQLAEQYRVKPLLWCSPAVEDESLEPAEVQIRSSRSVIEDTLDVFKRYIEAQVERLLRAASAPSAAATTATTVFLNFAEQDRDVALPLIERYSPRYTLFTPAQDASPAEMRDLNDSFYRSCDAAIFLDRNAPSRWMEAQLIQLIKVRNSRERPLKALAAVRPAARPPPTISIPDLQWLTVPDAVNAAAVSPVVDRVLAAIA